MWDYKYIISGYCFKFYWLQKINGHIQENQMLEVLMQETYIHSQKICICLYSSPNRQHGVGCKVITNSLEK